MYNLNSFNEIMGFMPLLIPFSLVSLGLMLFALIHAAKAASFKTGNKVLWILIIILIDIIGPVLYLVLGKSDSAEGDD
jgi:hypothetical protein